MKSSAQGTEKTAWTGRRAELGLRLWALGLLTNCAVFIFVATLRERSGVLFERDDPLGYYLTARSLVYDGDLNYQDELSALRRRGLETGEPFKAALTRTGRVDNNYTIGTALAAAPLYVPASLLRTFASRAPADALRFPWFLDQLQFSLAQVVLGWLGLMGAYRLACLRFDPGVARAAVALFFLGSPLLYYFCFEPFLSHLAAFAVASWLLFLWLRDEPATPRSGWLVGTLAGLLIIIRQQDAVLAVGPLAGSVMNAWSVPASHQRGSRRGRNVGALALGLLWPLLLQAGAWLYLRGSLLSFAYRGQGFDNWAWPRWTSVLFSSNHGALVWHPVWILAIAGWFLLARTDRALAWYAAFVAMTELYVVSAWWNHWFGHSFGHRGFLTLAPLGMLGLAACVERAGASRGRSVLMAVAAGLIVWNLLLMGAYLLGVIPHEGVFAWSRVFAGIADWPRLLAEKLGH
ncbi:MAG: hypothetical protein MUF51_00340 [Vicinamibacteria bacterium]|jgi:hypothetical protein|nr:hypothetical protein [Vicinamibacteria bacterium]